MVYYKAGNLNGLMFLLLIVFLYKADLESILKIYTWTSLSFIVFIILLSLVNVILILQFVQTAPWEWLYVTLLVLSIQPTLLLIVSISLLPFYLLRKKFIFLRTLSGVALWPLLFIIVMPV